MNSQKKSKNINLEISNLKNERINFIEKVNSINDVIKEQNIVSNVFINDIKENKIKVIESSKKTENDKIELDKTIKGIFS
jgi:uncharacterized protein YhaN